MRNKKGWGKLPLSNNLLIDDEKQKKIEIAKNIDDADEMELWAASAYVIDTNPVLFYKATHEVDKDMSERTLLMKARQWVNSPRIAQIVNYAKSSMLASEYVTPAMRRVLEEEKREKTKELINKDNLEFEDAVKLIESFLKRSDIDTADFKDVKGALDMLAKFKGWLSDDDDDAGDDFYDKTTIAFFPYDCDLCVRAKAGLCKKCVYHRESTGNLSDDERKWIKENDTWKG